MVAPGRVVAARVAQAPTFAPTSKIVCTGSRRNCSSSHCSPLRWNLKPGLLYHFRYWRHIRARDLAKKLVRQRFVICPIVDRVGALDFPVARGRIELPTRGFSALPVGGTIVACARERARNLA